MSLSRRNTGLIVIAVCVAVAGALAYNLPLVSTLKTSSIDGWFIIGGTCIGATLIALDSTARIKNELIRMMAAIALFVLVAASSMAAIIYISLQIRGFGG